MCSKLAKCSAAAPEILCGVFSVLLLGKAGNVTHGRLSVSYRGPELARNVFSALGRGCPLDGVRGQLVCMAAPARARD